MSGFLDALMFAAALTVPAAWLAWLAVVRLEMRPFTATEGLWRAARWAAVVPLLLAPVIFAVPEAAPVQAPAPPMLMADLPKSASHDFEATLAPQTIAWPSPRLSLAAVYVAGLALALVMALRRHLWRRRLIAESRPARPDERARLESHARALGVAAPEMRVSTARISPLLTGWGGVIVVPETIFADSRLEAFALVHELVHLRRGDERNRLMGSALVILLWFNIPLRWVERRLDAAREMACDAESLEALGGAKRKAYAAALIDMMRGAAQPASAFGPHDRRHREMRIKAILSGAPASPRARRVLAAAVLTSILPVAAAQAMLTERVEGRIDESPAPAPGFEIRADGIEVFEENGVVIARGDVDVLGDMNTHGFTHRVVDGRISHRYGARIGPNGRPGFHNGIDIAAPAGAPIHAPAGGVVTHADYGYANSDLFGNTVAIDHGDGWMTVFAHMDTIDVQPGQVIRAGHVIGGVGTTGMVTGPHVHVEIRRHGERVDPADYLPGLR